MARKRPPHPPPPPPAKKAPAPAKPTPGQPVKLGPITFNTAYSGRFAVFVKGARAEPAAECGERVYDAMAKWNPHFATTLQKDTDDELIPIFTVSSRNEQNAFKTWYFPVYKNAGAPPEAMTAIAGLWDKINGTQVNLDPESVKLLKCFQYGAFVNMESSKQKNEAMAPFRVHNTASTLHNLYLMPMFKAKDGAHEDLFWLTAGFAYFAEIRMAGQTETHILDYETMPDPKDKAGVKPQAYEDGKHWPDNLKKLVKTKKFAMPVAKIMDVNQATLTPDQLAYCFALQDFLHATPDRAAKFYNHLQELRAKPALPEVDALAKALGYDDADALDKAFWDYLKSGAFKS